jgi:hypothetical protein
MTENIKRFYPDSLFDIRLGKAKKKKKKSESESEIETKQPDRAYVHKYCEVLFDRHSEQEFAST